MTACRLWKASEHFGALLRSAPSAQVQPVVASHRSGMAGMGMAAATDRPVLLCGQVLVVGRALVNEMVRSHVPRLVKALFGSDDDAGSMTIDSFSQVCCLLLTLVHNLPRQGQRSDTDFVKLLKSMHSEVSCY